PDVIVAALLFIILVEHYIDLVKDKATHAILEVYLELLSSVDVIKEILFHLRRKVRILLTKLEDRIVIALKLFPGGFDLHREVVLSFELFQAPHTRGHFDVFLI